jgi:hypothetical protein
MNAILKKSIPHIIALAIFAVLVSIYFYPSLFEGKEVQQSDMQNVYGAGQELRSYYEEEGKSSAWTESVFSGMPAYHIYVYGLPTNYMKALEKPVKAIDYTGASMILTALVCFYILMCVIGVRRWLAIAGAVAFAFASYNFILVAVGHITKMYVIAYMPLTIAGMILLFRKRWLWGGLTFLLGVCFSVLNSHLQVTYYLALLCIFFFLGWFIQEIIKKEYSTLAKTCGIMLVGVALAILPSLGNLYSNYELAQSSMRGPSELVSEDGQKPAGGLNMDYAYNGWSYSKGELLTLFIPNAYGGASGGLLDKDSNFYKEYKKLGGQVKKNVQAPTYWGAQRFTEGPMYLGAIVCFLFILGMFVIKNKLKWWLAGASLFFILMSLGDHLLWFNEFLFNHLPMYNKFRVPSMALIIPGLVFPLIGLWGLKEIITLEVDRDKAKKSLTLVTSIVGGICLLIWLLPSLLLNFQSLSDEAYGMPKSLLDALIADRKSLASSDALRSLVFILLSAGLIYYYIIAKVSKQLATWVSIGLLVLITIDMWGVDKRYLNDDDFKKQSLNEGYKPTNADKYILQDKSESYRVLNLSSSTFNENHTSYFHKSIGGYHAAKLRRYQELIDHRINKEIQLIYQSFQVAQSLEDIYNVFLHTPTLNMLNTKYIIYHPDELPLENPYAFGNAWFVDGIKTVTTANEELAALEKLNPLTTAVKRLDLKNKAAEPTCSRDSLTTIHLLEYKPDYLKYESEASLSHLAVFSEIYYEHGWKAFIDGEPTNHFCVDWTLRGMYVSAGKHIIEFRFEPDKFNSFSKLASISSLILLLLLVGAIVFYLSPRPLHKRGN